MKKSVLLEKIKDAIWHGGGCTSNIQPDDLDGAAEAVLNEVCLYMEPKQGADHQTSYEIAMGCAAEFDEE